MIIPPDLVWLHLLPRDVSFVCQGPPRLAGTLGRAGADSPRRVLVTFGKTAAALPALDGYEAVVAIDCRGLSTAALQRAGFRHVRRLAVLPSLADVRWLIPLDSPAVSAGAFHLFAAIRRATRVKHAVARIVARTGAPWWYRDTICIAQRSAPPIAAALEGLFPGRDVRIALSSGAPGPVERRKPSAAVVDRDGRRLAFAKIAASPVSDALVRREAFVLRGLPRVAPEAGAPRALFADEVDGKFLLVQTALEGRPPSPRLTPAHHRLLDTLRRPERKPLLSTTWGAAIRERVLASPPEDRELVQIFEESVAVLEGHSIPTAVVHGDFVPWNLRGSAGTLAAYDWENAALDGVPLVDELHHRLVIGHLMAGWDAERAVREVDAVASDRPFGLERSHALALAVAYLVEHTTRLIDHGHEARDPMLLWFRELARRTAAMASPDLCAASS